MLRQVKTGPRLRRAPRVRTLVTAACLTTAWSACASPAAPRAGVLEPTAGLEEPLVELSYTGGMIANPDPTPFVRVYPGGRVVVHYPAYTKMAGDYSLHLEDEELQALLASFSNEEVLTIQPDDLHRLAQELRVESAGPLTDDHGVSSVVRIRGESFTPEDADASVIRNVDQTISASKGLLQAASESSAADLKSLADGVHALEELARSKALTKIE